VIGLPTALIPTALIFLLPGSLITPGCRRIGVDDPHCLAYHQAMGMNELHFGIFVLLAFLLSYRDWRPDRDLRQLWRQCIT